MALILVVPDLNQHDYEFSPNTFNPKVDENIQQSLVYLIGFDELSNQFRFAKVDNNGRLAVNTEALAKKTGSVGSITVDNTADLIAAENDDRNQLDLYNNGANTVYIGFVSTVLSTNGFPIPAGASFSFNNYNGAVYGITSAGSSDIRVMEVF